MVRTSSEEIKMRIAFIGCKGIPAATSHGGGVETHVEELAVRLTQDGHHVTVYVRPYANPRRLKRWHGVHLITLPTIHRKNLDAITHTFLSSLHAIGQGYDIIHYHGVGPSTLAWIPRLLCWKSNVVATFHSRDRFHEKWGWVARAYLALGEKAIVTFPHATIAVSHTIQAFCKNELHAKKTWHIPNGVDVPHRHPGTQHLISFGLQPDSYFMTLARLVPHKAIEDAIQAFREVKTDKRLVIVGSASFDDIAYEDWLHELAAEDPRIIFLGRQTGEPLIELLAHCYALIHPSRSEGLSVAVLEAMSFGKLGILSNIPENMELVDHTGIAYPVGNVPELYRVLEWAVGDPVAVAERGHRGREVVRKYFSWESVIKRTESIYSMLCPNA